MKHNKIIKGLLIVIAAIAVFFAVTAIVMQLWNAILPEIIGVKSITFWQSMGILVLSKILFSGFKGGGKRGFGRCRQKDWKNSIENMNTEQQEKLRQKLKERFENSPFCRKN